jgi:hypothetical protein
LHHTRVIAIVPPLSHQTTEIEPEPPEVVPYLRLWVRVGLLAIAAGLLVVFGIALWLKPYDDEGLPLRMETHRQLGLPSCQFYFVTGLPCPSCGMTTSFALLMHGDPWNSLRANAVGTLLACFCLFLIPWCLASFYFQRPLFIRSVERALTTAVVVFLTLMMIRWIIVLAVAWCSRTNG